MGKKAADLTQYETGDETTAALGQRPVGHRCRGETHRPGPASPPLLQPLIGLDQQCDERRCPASQAVTCVSRRRRKAVFETPCSTAVAPAEFTAAARPPSLEEMKFDPLQITQTLNLNPKYHHV